MYNTVCVYIYIYTPLANVLLCCDCVVAQLIGYHSPLGLNIFLNVATMLLHYHSTIVPNEFISYNIKLKIYNVCHIRKRTR